MAQQTTNKINEFADTSIRAFEELRELSSDIANISTVARENARFIQTLADINNQLTLLRTDVATLRTDVATVRTDVATVRTDVATVRTDMNSHFDVSEHKALIRMSNASCVRNNSRINWIIIPNRNLPQHRISNLGQFSRMSNVIALSYLEYYNLAQRNTVRENRKQLAQFLGIPVII
ncbi:unnamed protein product [Brachionus calyciflorus]|uniref:Uncharacterized protein n=1 Tax=Brachionus calyciflorus TaxID=104777 RepID=A0A813P199_9BILA|nr:unnamed protein product [Brachionus calyciflorus]